MHRVIVLARQHKHLLVLKASSSSKENKTQVLSSTSTEKAKSSSSDQSTTTANQSQATPASETKQNQKEPSASKPLSAHPINKTQAKSNPVSLWSSNWSQTPRQATESTTNVIKVSWLWWTNFFGCRSGRVRMVKRSLFHQLVNYSRIYWWQKTTPQYSYTLDDGKYNAEVGGGKVIQITTGADGTVSSVTLIKPLDFSTNIV